jgi:hypothetical protein
MAIQRDQSPNAGGSVAFDATCRDALLAPVYDEQETIAERLWTWISEKSQATEFLVRTKRVTRPHEAIDPEEDRRFIRDGANQRDSEALRDGHRLASGEIAPA